MTKTGNYEVALRLATEAHEGQTRWDGKPYITHPIAVSEMVSGEDEKIIALLHDVVEDTYLTYTDLEVYFEDYIVDAVCALTKNPKLYYHDNIKNVSYNRLATKIKIADLTHNLSTLNYKEHKNRIEKYELAKMYLELCLRN